MVNYGGLGVVLLDFSLVKFHDSLNSQNGFLVRLFS